MPNLGVIGELIVKIKAEDAKETGDQIKSVQKTTKDAGQEAKRQVPVLENMGRRWGAVLSLVAASGAVAFGMILKSSPSVMGALKGMQLAFESIFGLIGEELAPIFEWLEEILWKVSEAFENLSPETKTFIAGLTLAGIVAGVLAVAALAVAMAWPVVSAAVATVAAAVGVSIGWIIVIIGAVVLAVALLFTAWKHNWGGIQDKTKAALQFIKDVISRVTNWIKNLWDRFLGILFNKNLTTYGKLKALWGLFKETLIQIFRAISKEVLKLWDSIKRKTISTWNYIKVAVSNVLTKLKQIMAVIWADIKASAAEMWEDIKNVIIDKIKAAYDYVVDKINSMKSLFSKLSFGSIGSVSALSSTDDAYAAGESYTRTSGSLTISGPGRALGGNVAAGMGYTVGEHGRELFVPNVGGAIIPNNKIGKQTPSAPSQSTKPINIKLDLKLDGRTVWESMRRYSAAEIRRLGG